NYSTGRGTIQNMVECFGKDPLILSFSPRGEETLELSSTPGKDPQLTPSLLGERAGVRGSFAAGLNRICTIPSQTAVLENYKPATIWGKNWMRFWHEHRGAR